MRYSHSVLVFTNRAGARRLLPESTSKEPPTPMNTPLEKFPKCRAMSFSWAGTPKATSTKSGWNASISRKSASLSLE